MKNIWFFIRFKIVTVIILSLFFIFVIKFSDYDYFDNFKFFIGFVNENLSGIIFLVFLLCFIYYFIYYGFCNYLTLWKYKRENNENDKKYTAKFCEEDCIFDYVNKENIKKITDIMKENNKENKNKKVERTIETILNSGEKILETGKNVYLVNKKNYHHIADSYTFHKLGYPSPNQYRIGCFSKEGKELKEEIKIHNIISDINNILNIKNNI